MNRSVFLSSVALITVVAGQLPHITVVDCPTDSIVASLELEAIGVRPVAWDPRHNRIYASSGFDFWAVDCVSDSVVGREQGYFDPMECPYALDRTDNKLYCPWFEGVVVYDCSLMAVTDTIEFQGYLMSLVWASAQNKVYAARASNHDIVVIDCAGDSILRRIPTPGWIPGTLCVGDSSRRLYFDRNRAIGVLDIATDTLLPDIPVRDYPWQLLWNECTNELLAHDVDRILVVDCATDSVKDTVPCPGELCALDAAREILYAFRGTMLYKINLPTGLVADTVAGYEINRAEWDSTDNKLYAVSIGCMVEGDTLVVIDCSTFTVTSEIVLPDLSTLGIVWNPLMNKLYVGGDNWVGAVGEEPLADQRCSARFPSVLSRARLLAELHQGPSLSLFDATGRRILDLQPSSGVVFVGSAGTVNKVLLTD
jgi:hypothetical protein